MPTITGTLGNDNLIGTSGDDVIIDPKGNDAIDGGDGNDIISDSWGTDTLTGGLGNDLFRLVRPTDYSLPYDTIQNVTIYGGGGNDTVEAELSGQTQLLGNLGAGNDILRLTGYAQYRLNLGAGSDTVHVGTLDSSAHTILDFAAGDGGDVFNVSDAIQAYSMGGGNPFGTLLTLRQVGADVVLYLDTSGGGNPYTALVTFANTTLASFTAQNFLGFAPNGDPLAAGQAIAGTAAGEVIDGSAGADTINGGAGADTIRSYWSNDTIYGEGGNDTLYGGEGSDALDGGDGDDRLVGGAQSDTIHGGAGNDVIFGGDGAAYLQDGNADYIDGGAGDDILKERGGADTMLGGDGNDLITHLDYGNAVLEGGAGQDEIVVSHGLVGYYAPTGSYAVKINAGLDNDIVRYSSGASGSVLIGLGAGDDTLHFALGLQTSSIFTGLGSDRIVLSNLQEFNRSAIVVNDFQAGNGGDVIDLFTSLGQWSSGGATWDRQSNPFAGGFVILVQQGTDVLVRFDRDGTGSGSTAFAVAVLKNVDLASLTAYNFDGAPLDGSPIVGLTLDGTASGETLRGTIQDDTLNGLGGDDTILGLAGDDTLDGGDGNDIISGDAGTDVIHGGSGNDTITDFGLVEIYGEAGDDVIRLVPVPDYADRYGTINGGAGNDVIEASMFAYHLNYTGRIIAGAGNDTVTFSAGSNSNEGYRNWVRIDLGTGDDLLNLGATGALTNPVITLGEGRDRVVLTSYGIDGGPDRGTTIVFTDFTPGDAGDSIDISEFVRLNVRNLVGDNPFAGGIWMWLRQDGADVVVDMAYNVNGIASLEIIRFQNTTLAQFTDYNLGYHIDALAPPGVTLYADPAGDILNGTQFDDTLLGNVGDDAIYSQGGNDVMRGGAGNDWFYDAGGASEIIGGDGDDWIELGGGADMVNAGNGADMIILYDGQATIDGGAGFDTIDFAQNFTNSTAGIVWNRATFDSQHSFFVGGHAITNVENLLALDGTNGNDRIIYGAGWTSNLILDGRNGNDVIHGGDLSDTISGGAGDDFLAGFGDADDLFGGAGNDRLVGGDGSDSLTGGTGNDDINGGADQDFLYADEGDDTVRGGAGSDAIWGGIGTDTLYGDAGDDMIYLHLSGGDVIDGGVGIDYLNIGGGQYAGAINLDFSAVWSGGFGIVNGANFTMTSIERINGILTSASDRVIIGNGMVDTVDLGGAGGDDYLVAGGGNDTLLGDQGNDSLWGNNGDDVIHGDDRYGQGAIGHDEIHGGLGDDDLYGDAGDDLIFGDAGIDFLSGGAGNDNLQGGAGDDHLVGGDGNDRIAGGAGRDSIDGGAGDDTIVLDGFTDDSINGFSGSDTLLATIAGSRLLWTGSNIGDIEVIDASAIAQLTVIGTAGNDLWFVESLAGLGNPLQILGTVIFNAGAGNDTIYGMTGTQNLRGGAGDDIIDGGIGADLMYGEAGNDHFYVEDAGDRVIEGANGGTDEVRATINYTLTANVENLVLEGPAVVGRGNNLDNFITGNELGNTLFGLDGNDLLDGNWGNDTLRGGNGLDTLIGNVGNDWLYGEAGNDTLDGGTGLDTIYGGDGDDGIVGGWDSDRLYGDAGNDTIEGNEGNDIIDGGTGDDDLFGGLENDNISGGIGIDILLGEDGNDLLNGGDDADLLIGGFGRDVMTGGAGGDNFAFVSYDDISGATAATADRITDFSQAQGDHIDLSVLDANYLLAGRQAFTFLGTGAFNGGIGQLRYEHVGGNTVIYADLDGDRVADGAILLDGVINLTAADFFP